MFEGSVITAILSLSVYGLTIVIASEAIKKVLNKILKSTAQWIGYLSTVISSAGFTAYYLITTHAFTWIAFAGYTVLVCLTGNMLFKTVHTKSN
jgi:riboflavin transporter FmnP